MKFIGGFVAGVATTVFVLFVILMSHEDESSASVNNIPGLTMLPEKGKCIIRNDVEIFQALKPNLALAKSGRSPNETIVLLINHEGELYYDGQKIGIPPNKCARQIGVYRYTTTSERLRTVPAVVIE